jgi:hypothetical protein
LFLEGKTPRQYEFETRSGRSSLIGRFALNGTLIYAPTWSVELAPDGDSSSTIYSDDYVTTLWTTQGNRYRRDQF